MKQQGKIFAHLKKMIVVHIAVVCVILSFASYAAEDAAFKDIRFPESGWSGELLKTIEVGAKYLDKDLPLEIQPPPENDSAQTKLEIETLREYARDLRSDETVAMIKAENVKDPFVAAFGHAGLFAADKKNRKTENLVNDVIYESGYFILREKWRFQRARPAQLAPDLPLVIETPPHSSYPSGHAGQAYAAALLLSEIDPENKDRYMKQAHDIGLRREIAGVHYPSDSEAGRKIAAQVMDKLMEIPEFQEKLKQAKATFVKPK